MPNLPEDIVRSYVSNLVTWRESPALAMGGASTHQTAFAAADLGRGWSLFNSVTLLRPLDESNVSEVLAAVSGFYSPDRKGKLLLWSAWPTPDLRPFGWRLYDDPWLMRRSPNAETPAQAGLRIEEVRTADQLREFLAVVGQAFRFEDLLAEPESWDTRVLADPRIRCWLGRLDGEAVSTSTTVEAGGVNGVMLVATLAPHRRRGFGGALAERAARGVSILPASLTADDDVRALYERLGFEKVRRFTVWTAPRPSRA